MANGKINTQEAAERIIENSMLLMVTTRRHGNKATVPVKAIEVLSKSEQDKAEGVEESDEEELELDLEGEEAPAPSAPVNKTIETSKTKKRLLTVRKTLLDSKEWQAIKNFDQQTYRWLQDRALKSNLRPGTYRLPLALWDDVQKYLSQREEERWELVNAFIAARPALMQKAARQLDSIFNPADYASEAKVRADFQFKWVYREEIVPGKLKSISHRVYQEQQLRAKGEVEREVAAMVNELRAGFSSLISHAAEKLSPGKDGKPQQFKPSTLDNINAFLDLFDKRNLAGDTTLAEMVKEARRVMKGITPTELRKNPGAREEVLKSFANMNVKLDGLIQAKPNRKIRILED